MAAADECFVPRYKVKHSFRGIQILEVWWEKKGGKHEKDTIEYL